MHVISQRGDYRVGLSGPIIYFYEHMRCRLFLSSHVSMIHDLERSRHVQSLALGFLFFECFLKGITYQGALSLHTVVNFASKIVASEINACAYYSCTHNLRWSCVRSTFLKTHMSTVPHKYQQRSRTKLQLGNSAITPENAIQKTGALSTIVKRIVLLCSKTLCFINFTTLFWPLSVPTTSKGAATLFCLRSFLTATAVSGCAKSIPRSQRRVRTATRSEGGWGGDRRRGYPRASVADECGWMRTIGRLLLLAPYPRKQTPPICTHGSKSNQCKWVVVKIWGFPERNEPWQQGVATYHR